MNGWTKALTLTTAVCLGACSSEQHDEHLAAVDQPFGVASCGTAVHDEGFTGHLPLWGVGGGGSVYATVSPSTYNTCFKAYVVDIENLDTTRAAGNFLVNWYGDHPTTPTSCEAAWGSAIFYKKVAGDWAAQGSPLEAYGSWVSNECRPPSISSSLVMTLAAGESYRMAGTMRTAYAGPALRSIIFRHTP
jgi:hypothetical protein